MEDPFIGEITLMAFDFPPRNWAQCNGQILPIAQNQSLFALLGTTFGGNGTTNFALPDLRGRVAMGVGNTHTLSERAGAETVTLLQSQMPAHTHSPNCSSATGNQAAPGGNTWAKSTNDNLYSSAAPDTAMNAAAVQSAGGGQAHENRQPFLALNYVIALAGFFRSRD